MTHQAMTPGSLLSVAARSVRLAGGPLFHRVLTNSRVTVPTVLRRCEETGRVENLRAAARPGSGFYRGVNPFEDTDVFKALEGASGCLALTPDPALDARVDELIAAVAAAQEPDGYLYSARTNAPTPPIRWTGPSRWSSLLLSHELYNVGHLVEAACAHFEATGKTTLLEVARRSADLVGREFREGGRHDACGHPLVERALARLARVTGERRYLETARFLLEQRGRHEGRTMHRHEANVGYAQDHLPVADQRVVTGHAVRAMYLYAGMADVATQWPEARYDAALDSLWPDLLASKIYLTGGVGARHECEAFGEAYELPNDTAYCETCAAIGLAVWARRMFLSRGRAEFLDVEEQVLYNGILSGVSLGGEEFFYVNPLASDGVFGFSEGCASRQPWYTVSCCPTSVCRFLPTVPGLLYAQREGEVTVCHYAESTAALDVDGAQVSLRQETRYPWDGSVVLHVSPSRPVRARLRLRVPGWARGSILGGALYTASGVADAAPVLSVNGARVSAQPEDGFAVLDREWRPGDSVELVLPMPVLRVRCDPRVEGNRGRAALQRGPTVYCVEGRDAAVPLESLVVAPGTGLQAAWRPDLLGGIITLQGRGFTAIPYAVWNNRGAGPMQVWLNEA